MRHQIDYRLWLADHLKEGDVRNLSANNRAIMGNVVTAATSFIHRDSNAD